MKEVTKYLIDRTQKKLAPLFENASNTIGLLFNERFINIPPQVSVPLLQRVMDLHNVTLGGGLEK